MRVCHRWIAPAEIPSSLHLPSSGAWDIIDLCSSHLQGCGRAATGQLTVRYTHLECRARGGRGYFCSLHFRLPQGRVSMLVLWGGLVWPFWLWPLIQIPLGALWAHAGRCRGPRCCCSGCGTEEAKEAWATPGSDLWDWGSLFAWFLFCFVCLFVCFLT